ncbi:MAG: acetoin utilization protein AcuC [Thermoleophilia bacterium]|nr:acetoin utilization protein AcuC [Thermoleophilia bacterium]
MTTTAFVFDEAMLGYDLGDDHPLSPLRRSLAVDLIRAYGLLDRDDVDVVAPRAAVDDEIARAHAPSYIAATKRYSADPMMSHEWEAAQWGFAAGGDTPAFTGMHEAAAYLCGASITAAMEVWEGRAAQAFSAGGGLHHALHNRAAGFCVYNDPAVAIHALLGSGAERVAYIDVDVHHGDGTQWIFYEDPRVLTCSVHESGRYLFPGTGHLAERGVGAAEGTAVNIPLPPYAGEAPYLRAVEDVIAPAVAAFDPDIIVTQNGADPHHRDPLAHLQITMGTYPRLYRALVQIARETAGGRLVALGGGGYHTDVVPRAWTMLFAGMLGVELDDEIPHEWVAKSSGRAGMLLTPTLLGDEEPEIPAGERARADAEGHQVVDQARLLLRM